MTKRPSQRKKFLLIIGSILFLTIIGAGLFLIQSSLKQNQDLRQQAAVDTGAVEVKVLSSGNFTPNQELTTYLTFNTHQVQTDGLELAFNIESENIASTPTVTILPESGLSPTSIDVQPISGGYKVKLLALPTQIGQAISNNTDTQFAEIKFTPTAVGSISFVFDSSDSFAPVHGSTEDQLKTIPPVQLAVGGSETTPVPSPTPDNCTRSSSGDIVCPSFVAPSDNFCQNGTIINPTADECGCYGPPECILNSPYPSATPIVTPRPSPWPTNIPFKECVDSSECPVGQVCSSVPSGGCGTGPNGEALACATAPQCRRASGVSCDLNSDCYSGYACIDSLCRVATPPTSPTPSPVATYRPTPHCPNTLCPDGKVCVDPCEGSNIQCYMQPTCTSIQGLGCTTDADCQFSNSSANYQCSPNNTCDMLISIGDPAPSPSPSPTVCQINADINCDGKVNLIDFTILMSQFSP